MILLSTLWETIKWKKILFWYGLISFGLVLGHDQNSPLIFAVVGHIALTMLTIIVFFMVWNKVIYGHGEGFPLVWIFSTVVNDIRIFEKKEGDRLLEMECWCKENCLGKWKHCEHGYFVFRQKTDAMAFKLTWI